MTAIGIIGIVALAVLFCITGAFTWFVVFDAKKEHVNDWLVAIGCVLLTIGIACAIAYSSHAFRSRSLRVLPDEPCRTEINSDNEAIFVGTDAEKYEHEYRAFRKGMEAGK